MRFIRSSQRNVATTIAAPQTATPVTLPPRSNGGPVVELYGAPSPPKSFFFAGAGWAYGIGCGVGPFFGMGVAFGPGPLFGAGAGAGVYCGCGFGAGLVVGNGSGYVPYGATTSFFYTPRLMWAERIVERRRRREKSGERYMYEPARMLKGAWNAITRIVGPRLRLAPP